MIMTRKIMEMVKRRKKEDVKNVFNLFQFKYKNWLKEV